MRSRLLAFALVLLLAAPARAGTYEHYTLSASAPGFDGWSQFVRAPRGYVGTTAGPGGLTVQFHTRTVFDVGDLGEWVYTAPADTTIAGWEIERAVSGIAGGGWNTLFAATGDGRARFVSTDVPSHNQPMALMRAGGLSAVTVAAILDCAGPVPCSAAGTAMLVLRNSRVVLHDPFAPVASSARGDLAGDGRLAGTVALSFSATDRGGGLYRAYASVDGRRRPPVAIGDGRCRDVLAGGSDYQFAFRQPCPLSGGAVVAIDTTELSDGPHTFAVAVEDAAGNAVAVYGPSTRTVDNLPDPPPVVVRPPAPSRPVVSAVPRLVTTAWLERRGRRSAAVTADYGERVRLRGRVTDAAGRPVAGAAVELAEKLSGRAWRPITGLRTLADGRFTAFTRVGPSRRLRIAAPGGGAAPVLTLRVRAGVTARVSGGVVRGRLRGGYVPRGGALVELQERTGRRWVTRAVVRTFRSGRFSGRLRPSPRGPIRARVPAQPGLPFAAGVSPPSTAGRTAAGTSR